MIETFDDDPDEEDYSTFDLGNAGLTRGAKALALKNNYDVYEHKSWDLQPKKYGPKAYALSVPTVVLEAAQAKIQWQKEQEQARAERRLADPDAKPLNKGGMSGRIEAVLRTKQLFPSMPEGVAEEVVERAWSNHHVGTVHGLQLDTKIMLAVEAHVRYQETEFATIKNDLYRSRREEFGGFDRYDRYDRYNRYDDGEDPYTEAWESVRGDIVDVMSKWMAPPGTEPTGEMRRRADNAVSTSMANNDN